MTTLPLVDDATRRRADVCTAAALLTALGVLIRVRAPEVPWPRSGPSAGW